MSILAVASSIKTILLDFKKALQIHNNCLSPTESESLPILAYKPPLYSINSAKLHYLAIFIISASEYISDGSKFCLIVVLINVGSCSIIVIFERRSFRL